MLRPDFCKNPGYVHQTDADMDNGENSMDMDDQEVPGSTVSFYFVFGLVV